MEVYSSNVIRWLNNGGNDPSTNMQNFDSISQWWNSQTGKNFRKYHTSDSGTFKKDPTSGSPILDFQTGVRIWDPQSFTDLGNFVALQPMIKLQNGNALVSYDSNVPPIDAYVVDVDFDRNLLILWHGLTQQAIIYKKL